MLLPPVVQDASTEFTPVSNTHLTYEFIWHSQMDEVILAQTLQTDVFADAREAFINFVESGQAWALLIGLVLGYLIKGLTTYG